MSQTQEAPKFLLLEAIMDVIDEKIGQEKLRSKLDDSRKSLMQIRAEFEMELEELDPKLKEGAANEIQMVYKVFGDWENAFNAVEEFFSTGKKFDLIRAGEMVKRSSELLNSVFTNFRNQVFLVMGPTDIPSLNMLIEACEEVKKKNVPLDKLKVITANEFILADGAIDELEFERKFVQFMEQELLIQAYKELKEGISKIGHFIKDGKKDMLDKGLEECKIVYPKIKELLALVNYQRMIQKPTSSPNANLLLNMSYALKKGEIDEDMFVQTLKDNENDFNKLKVQFEALTRQETDSVLVKEEMQKAMEGLKLFSNAINDYYKYLDTREVLFIQQAEWQLKDAVEILEKSHQVFQDVADREGKTPCVRCGHFNQPERKTCEKCGAILPKAADVSAASTFDLQVGETTLSLDSEDEVTMPENIEMLFNAVNQVSEQEISLEEFENIIEDFYALMEANKNAGFAPLPQVNLDNLKPDEKKTAQEIMDKLKEAKPLFEEGFRDFEEGIEYFREYLEVNDDKNLLVKGVQIIWEGNKKFHQVEQLTKDLQNLKKS